MRVDLTPVAELVDFKVYYLEHFCCACGRPYTYPEGCNPQWCAYAPAAITAREWKDTLERLMRLEEKLK